MSASTESGKKFETKADGNGNYKIEVTHKGKFTLTAEYTGTAGADGKYNYTASDAKPVKTTKPKEGNQNIALKYGRTTNVSGKIQLNTVADPDVFVSVNDATVIVKVDGVEEGRAVTKPMEFRGMTRQGRFSFDFKHHGGDITIEASHPDASAVYSRTTPVGIQKTIAFNLSLTR